MRILDSIYDPANRGDRRHRLVDFYDPYAVGVLLLENGTGVLQENDHPILLEQCDA
jgi:hypothetical protein